MLSYRSRSFKEFPVALKRRGARADDLGVEGRKASKVPKVLLPSMQEGRGGKLQHSSRIRVKFIHDGLLLLLILIFALCERAHLLQGEAPGFAPETHLSWALC